MWIWRTQGLLCFEELSSSCSRKGSGRLSISQEIRIW
ncbi:hypothetical protein Gotri_016029 [Gossypium trilobum]|uniref:Uncharacterized protein n=1 Tax=Gossypium trilobum TaxID=34281 RepID=A0A7J9E2J9_9ROSI|nr:hypothetical protein [Gossypium trilobum]